MLGVSTAKVNGGALGFSITAFALLGPQRGVLADAFICAGSF